MASQAEAAEETSAAFAGYVPFHLRSPIIARANRKYVPTSTPVRTGSGHVHASGSARVGWAFAVGTFVAACTHRVASAAFLTACHRATSLVACHQATSLVACHRAISLMAFLVVVFAGFLDSSHVMLSAALQRQAEQLRGWFGLSSPIGKGLPAQSPRAGSAFHPGGGAPGWNPAIEGSWTLCTHVVYSRFVQIL